MGPTHRLAIDLGTCHTVAVVRRGDEAPRALLFDGSPVMASGIYADEHGRLSVGRDAERLSQLAPERFEPYPKRSVDEGSVLLGQVEVTVVEMLASLLRRAAEESLQAGVNPVGSTVLTCPADWGGQRRGVLLEAARAANLGPVVLVDEPIAAATYCLRVLGQQVAPLQSLAVFDFGGGTLDVSVVRREFDGLRVLGVGGLDDLGGVDIDAALVGHLGQLINLRHPELWQRLANPDSTAAHRDRRALWTEVRAAKEMLSRATSAPIHLPGTEEALHLTREELERVAGPLIDRAVDETRRVLERAGVDVRQLAGIFLVGGSSRIPLVASRLHARFGVAPVVPEQPELPVAYGGLLAVATAPQQQFDAPAVPRPRPVSGTPVSPGYSPAFPPAAPFPVSNGFPASSVPTSPSGAYGSPAGMASQTFAPGPSSTAPRPPPPPPFAPPPVQPPGQPSYLQPQPRKKRRVGGWIALVIVLAIVGGCVWGGRQVYLWTADKVTDAKDAVDRATGDGGFGVSGNGGPALKVALEVPAPSGAGATAVAVGPDTLYYAVAVNQSTTVVAYDPAGRKERWKKVVAMEPAELTMRVTGTLLVVDGANVANYEGKPVRATLALADGAQKFLGKWDNLKDVAFFGNDVLVAAAASGTGNDEVRRIDLTTGQAKWSKGQKRRFPSGSWVMPSLTYAAAGPPEGQGVPALHEGDDKGAGLFNEPLYADPAKFVTLDDSGNKTKGSVRNGGGDPTVTADLPLEPEFWWAYGGMVVGQLDDTAAPGRVAIAGFGMDNLGKRWEFALPAGADLQRLRPCGEALVCVGYTVSSKPAAIAIDMKTGTQRWKRDMKDFSEEPSWFLVGPDLLFGKNWFGSVEGPSQVLKPDDNTQLHELGSGNFPPYVIGSSGRNVLLESVKVIGGGTARQVSVLDLAIGKNGDAVIVTDADQAKQYAFGPRFFAAVGADLKVRFWSVEAPGK